MCANVGTRKFERNSETGTKQTESNIFSLMLFTWDKSWLANSWLAEGLLGADHCVPDIMGADSCVADMMGVDSCVPDMMGSDSGVPVDESIS